ncbi:MAG: hypothetical protein IRY99_13045 [Isosphaeraceae bacterium]|nr:hypothetical protein [Isosphaeraceae bacterium]
MNGSRTEEIRRTIDVLGPTTIEQITLVISQQALASPAEMLSQSGLIIRTDGPRDWKAAVAALLPELTFAEARYAGQTYHVAPIDKISRLGYFTPDDRTFVLAAVPYLFRFWGRGQGPDWSSGLSWAGAWKAIADGQAAVALDVGCLREVIEPALKEAGELAVIAGMVAPLWEETGGFVLGLNVRDGLALDLRAACGSESGGVRVEETLRAALVLARNASRSFPPFPDPI